LGPPGSAVSASAPLAVRVNPMSLFTIAMS
jgi:hypothetical protein